MSNSTIRKRTATCFTFVALYCVACVARAAESTTTSPDRPPNVVIIFIDDLGYADIGPFGATAYKTPHLDRMAAGGRKFTDFHAATAVCSASRAALMTGCYPERVSIRGALNGRARHGLHPQEVTIAEICKQRDYATAIYGKWHLGHLKEFLPLQQGFDEYYGLPYSNDMWPWRRELDETGKLVFKPREGVPNLPLYEGNEVVDDDVTAEDQAQLTTAYTEHAVDFINRNKDRPFFLYVPHTMVHVPLFVSDKFLGKSGAGLFGDVVMEVDWSVGQILDALKKNGIDDNTLVIFTADNGPWLTYGTHAGSAEPLREGKGTMFEGGYRVACLMRWPGKIPAGTTCDELSSTIDILPTVAKLIGTELPADRVIDGKDIWPLIAGEPGAESPHEAFWCYWKDELQAVRDRRWKLHFPHTYHAMNGQPTGSDGMRKPARDAVIGKVLYDLKNDVGETTDVSAEHSDVVARLEKLAEAARASLGDSLTGRRGTEIRPHGEIRNK